MWSRRADFSEDEWMIMGRAIIASGALVSLSDGGHAEDMIPEFFAITKHLRSARFGHPNLAGSREATVVDIGDYCRAERDQVVRVHACGLPDPVGVQDVRQGRT